VIIAEGTGATVQGVKLPFVKSLPLPLPPLPEQERIVGILDEAFEGIAKAKATAETNLQNARTLFQSHLQSVFSQRGDGWVEKPLGDFCNVKHGYAFDGADFSNQVPEGYPLVITTGNFTEDGRLLFNEKYAKRFRGKMPVGFKLELGDLIVVMTDLSSKMKILGKPAFVDRDDILHNQRIGLVEFFNESVTKKLLYYFMMTDVFLANIKSSATGTMVKHTAPKRILNNVIPVPVDYNKQTETISLLDNLREESQRLESLYQSKLDALDELKKSLLHQAFSGNM
jgi:type I restriction enzyme S subunit